jgi:hypothetical protein
MGVNACGLVFFGFTFLTFVPRSKLPIADGCVFRRKSDTDPI